MSSRDPLPEPWRSVLESKGVSSRRDLASKTGIAVATAIRLVNGEGAPSQATVDAVAKELFNGDRNRVRELAGLSGQDHGEWQVPDEVALLDPQQRAAVEAVIRAMVPQELRRGDGDDRRDAAPIAAVPDLTDRPAVEEWLDDEAARDVGRQGSVARRRQEQDAAGQPTGDDPDDMEPR